jgi:HD superfamily phosphohydrolase
MTDSELIENLKKIGDFQYEIVTRLKYRELFKQSYALSMSNLDERHIDLVKELEDVNLRREKEKDFEESLNIPAGHVVIDVPYQELRHAEPRIDQTDIGIIEKGEIKSLDEFTPVAKAIRSRAVPDWGIMIVTDDKYRDVVSKNAEKVLFK